MQKIPDFNKPKVDIPQDYEAHLLFSASIYDDDAGEEFQRQQPMTLTGYTQRISRDALSLVGPFYHFGYRYLMGRDRALQIELHLPDATVSIQGLPVRYTKMSEGESVDGYIMTGPNMASFGETDVNCLIEVSMVVMSDSDRLQLAEYLRQFTEDEADETLKPPKLTLVKKQERAA
jgi:hypothetical protein